MDCEIYGRHSGAIKKLHFQESGDNKTIVTLSWPERNAGNDVAVEVRHSIVVDTSELRLLKDIL
jgi:hypothetical protein